jgi:hypothetical protein
VTRLDEPSSVTIQKGKDEDVIISTPKINNFKSDKSDTIVSTSKKVDTAEIVDDDNGYAKTNVAMTKKTIATSSTLSFVNSTKELQTTTVAASTVEVFPPSHWVEKGGITSVVPISSSKNDSSSNNSNEDNKDSHSIKIYWGQERHTVHVRIPVQSLLASSASNITQSQSIKWNCHVTNMIQYEDRFTAVGQHQSKQQLRITMITNQISIVVMDVTMYHPIYLPNDDDDVDWTIEAITHNGEDKYDNPMKLVEPYEKNNEKKYISLILYKATPMMGLTIWWKKPFIQCNEETDIKSWKNDGDMKGNEFHKVWQEAHTQFLAKHSKKKKDDNDNDIESDE